VIEDLEYMREKGVEAWVAEQEAKGRCAQCGISIYWHARECPNCHERVTGEAMGPI
jgi:Zn finger protein HypA/HybF involved in hydrogenase expression